MATSGSIFDLMNGRGAPGTETAKAKRSGAGPKKKAAAAKAKAANQDKNRLVLMAAGIPEARDDKASSSSSSSVAGADSSSSAALADLDPVHLVLASFNAAQAKKKKLQQKKKAKSTKAKRSASASEGKDDTGSSSGASTKGTSNKRPVFKPKLIVDPRALFLDFTARQYLPDRMSLQQFIHNTTLEWNKLSEESRQTWELQAKANAKMRSEESKLKALMPKKPLNKWGWFCRDKRSALGDSGQQIKQVNKELSAQYKQLNEAQLAPYAQQAKQDKERFEREMDKFRAEHGSVAAALVPAKKTTSKKRSAKSS